LTVAETYFNAERRRMKACSCRREVSLLSATHIIAKIKSNYTCSHRDTTSI